MVSETTCVASSMKRRRRRPRLTIHALMVVTLVAAIWSAQYAMLASGRGGPLGFVYLFAIFAVISLIPLVTFLCILGVTATSKNPLANATRLNVVQRVGCLASLWILGLTMPPILCLVFVEILSKW